MNQQGGNDHRNILWSIFTKECCWPGGGQTLITSRTRIQLSHRGRLSNPVITPKPVSLRTWWIVLKYLSVSESVASELYSPYVCLCWMIFLKKKKTPTKNKKTTNTHMCLWFGANVYCKRPLLTYFYHFCYDMFTICFRNTCFCFFRCTWLNMKRTIAGFYKVGNNDRDVTRKFTKMKPANRISEISAEARLYMRPAFV